MVSARKRIHWDRKNCPKDHCLASWGLPSDDKRWSLEQIFFFLTHTLMIDLIIEPVHEISNNVVCTTSKTSDQPAHTRSLIRAFASRLSILWLLSYWLNIIWSLFYYWYHCVDKHWRARWNVAEHGNTWFGNSIFGRHENNHTQNRPVSLFFLRLSQELGQWVSQSHLSYFVFSYEMCIWYVFS